jgi:hypothetical protein
MFPVSYRDLELMLTDRGVKVEHTTVFRWIQACAPELEKRPRLRCCNGSWRVDEIYIKVKGRWSYLYRAVHRISTAQRTLAGYEAMARKGQVRKVGGRDMKAQGDFIANAFQIAA